jgi:hypothetical protein
VSNVATLENALIFHVITFDTSDYPGMYVVRRHFIVEGEVQVEKMGFVAHTLEGVRECVPPGLFRLPRAYDDNPVIVESWI